MRACIYARYSSTMQSDGFSIEGQIHACTEFANRNNYQIVKTYVDEAKSGTSDKRTSFQEMLTDARSLEKPFDYILVYNYERFSRSRQDQINYKNELRFLDIYVVSITQPIDHQSPDSVLLESLYEGMAEQYSRKLSRDVKRGMIEAAKRGYWTGGRATLGYKLHKTESGKKKLIICDETSIIIKKIFSLYASKKYGIKKITKIINKEYPNSGILYSTNRITDILKNKRYTGSMIWGENQDQNKRGWSIKEKVVEVKNSHEAIIDIKTFNKVQKILLGRKTYTQKKLSKHLLSGLIKCGKCGSSVMGTPAKSGKYLYYTCVKKRKTGQCDMRSINSTKIESRILTYLQKNIFKKSYLDKALKKMLKNRTTQNEDIKKDTLLLNKKLLTLEKKKSKLLVLVETTDVDMEDVATRLKTLSAEIKETKTRIEINEEKSKINKHFNKVIDEDTILLFKDTALNLIKESVSNETISKFVRTITLNEENIQIQFSLSENLNSLSTKVRKRGHLVVRETPFKNFTIEKNPFFEVYNNLDLKQKIKV
tara:strand:+ start:28021 stop:29637 length:1617 start_codon:yes stop_codon:yes gene_type:complete